MLSCKDRRTRRVRLSTKGGNLPRGSRLRETAVSRRKALAFNKQLRENVVRRLRQPRVSLFIGFRLYLVGVTKQSKGEGDSGSRHAFEKAIMYGKKRFVTYRESDYNNLAFGLNKDYVIKGEKILTLREINRLV